MEWTEAVKTCIQNLKPVSIGAAEAKRIISLIDLTRLIENDTESDIAQFCDQAETVYGHVAAVCVLPQFVRLMAAQFTNKPVKVATVANFPEGTAPLDDVLIEISRAIEDGAHEIDVVFPYARYLAGERNYARAFVTTCKSACGDNVVLKVILETSALQDPALLADACYDVLRAGADFVKTSTGKLAEGATLQSAATLLLVVRHLLPQLARPLGVKVSGGIKTPGEAAQYIELADQILGKDWVTPATFRIGASQLLNNLLKEIG